MDLVLITSYNRPQYLRLCLDYLSKAEGIYQDKAIWLFIDRGRTLIREFYEVLNDFPKLNVRITFRDYHNYHGNSYNTLEAYKEAFHSEAKYVYLVEDDVLVMPDFFKWHETIQKQESLMCSVAYRCHRNPAAKKINDPEAYLVSAQDYASIGVCWKRQRLAPVVSHACTQYYDDLNGYIKHNFPKNRFAGCFTEQDGLIMRIMGEKHGLVAWSFIPRCYHVGFAGYNRPRGPQFSYEELKEVIHNKEKVRNADRDFGDIEVVPELVPEWDKLYCAQRFN